MGKIRNDLIKRSAERVVETYPDRFPTEFEENKTRLMEVASIPSKRLRNRIAGYITRMKKIEAQSRDSAE